MMSAPLKSNAIFLTILLLISPAEGAKNAGGGYVGPVTGLTMPSGGSSSFTLGLKGAYSFLSFARTAAFFYTFGSGVESTTGTDTISASQSTKILGIEGVYPFSPAFSAGLKVGKISNSLTSTTTVGGTTLTLANVGSSFFVGPTIQYDHPLGSFTAGGELNYLHALSSSVSGGIQILASGKYWF